MVIISDVPALIINLPIILSIIAITRYVIGFKTWKTYPTLAFTLAFFSFFQTAQTITNTTILWSLFTAIIIGSALLTRKVISRFTMNYYARIAIMYLAATVASLVALLILDLAGFGSIATNIFTGLGVFLIGSTIDELATLLYKKDKQEFIRRAISTTVVAFCCGILLTWGWWNTVIVNHQEILLVVLLLNIVTAAWSALRLTEFLRFGSLSKN